MNGFLLIQSINVRDKIKINAFFFSLLLRVPSSASIITKAAENNDQVNNAKDYESELKIVKKVFSAQRDSIIGGIVVGSLAFLSVRTLPRLAIRLIGGDQAKIKMEKLRQSELALRNSPKGFLKRSGSEYDCFYEMCCTHKCTCCVCICII